MTSTAAAPDSTQAIREFYTDFRNFLDIGSAYDEANQKRLQINKAQEKLLKLPASQFTDLATDVHDELLRRIDQNHTLNSLLPIKSFHPKRNISRQKLAFLSENRFHDLSFDILYEIERRYPTIKQPSLSAASNDDTTSPQTQNVDSGSHSKDDPLSTVPRLVKDEDDSVDPFSQAAPVSLDPPTVRLSNNELPPPLSPQLTTTLASNPVYSGETASLHSLVNLNGAEPLNAPINFAPPPSLGASGFGTESDEVSLNEMLRSGPNAVSSPNNVANPVDNVSDYSAISPHDTRASRAAKKSNVPINPSTAPLIIPSGYKEFDSAEEYSSDETEDSHSVHSQSQPKENYDPTHATELAVTVSTPPEAVKLTDLKESTPHASGSTNSTEFSDDVHSPVATNFASPISNPPSEPSQDKEGAPSNLMKGSVMSPLLEENVSQDSPVSPTPLSRNSAPAINDVTQEEKEDEDEDEEDFARPHSVQFSDPVSDSTKHQSIMSLETSDTLATRRQSVQSLESADPLSTKRRQSGDVTDLNLASTRRQSTVPSDYNMNRRQSVDSSVSSLVSHPQSVSLAPIQEPTVNTGKSLQFNQEGRSLSYVPLEQPEEVDDQFKNLQPQSDSEDDSEDNNSDDDDEDSDNSDELTPIPPHHHPNIDAAMKAWSYKNSSQADISNFNIAAPRDLSTSSEDEEDDPGKYGPVHQYNLNDQYIEDEDGFLTNSDDERHEMDFDDMSGQYQTVNYVDDDMRRYEPLQVIEEEQSPYIPPNLLRRSSVTNPPPEKRRSLSETLSSSIMGGLNNRYSKFENMMIIEKDRGSIGNESQATTAVSNTNTAIEFLEAQVKRHQATIKEKDDHIKTLVDEGSKLDDTIGQLQKKLQDAETMNQRLIEENQNLVQKNGQLYNSVAQHEIEVKEVKEEYESQNNQLAKELEEKSKSYMGLETQLSKLKEKHMEVLSKQTEFAGSSANLSSQIMFLESKLINSENVSIYIFFFVVYFLRLW